MQYNGDVSNNARLDIVIGLPGAGKSSAIVDVISNEFHSKIIDNDEAKKLIPEYNNGWGASVVHEESQRISEKQLRNSMLHQENIVLPKVGSNPEKLKKIIVSAQMLNYKVNVHYVDLEREKALGRMLSRFVEEGRFLDPKLIDKYHNNIDGNKIARCYEILKKGGIVDGYSRWNNDVGKGERPILIEAECTGEFIRNARTSEHRASNNLRNVGRVGNERGGSVTGYDRKHGTMEVDDRQGDISKDRRDLQTGRRGTESARLSVKEKLHQYQNEVNKKNQHKDDRDISDNHQNRHPER